PISWPFWSYCSMATKTTRRLSGSLICWRMTQPTLAATSAAGQAKVHEPNFCWVGLPTGPVAGAGGAALTGGVGAVAASAAGGRPNEATRTAAANALRAEETWSMKGI